MEERNKLKEQVERLCDMKACISDRIKALADKRDNLTYSPQSYGSMIDKHADEHLKPEDIINETIVRDNIKQDFDNKNSEQMEKTRLFLNSYLANIWWMNWMLS